MGCVQCSLIRHCRDGKCDDLLLARDQQREQEVPHSAGHHRVGNSHRDVSLLPIFNSWNDAFNVKYVGSEYQVFLTGQPFNDAYRYVDWVLTVPLLLIELILVMGLPAEETVEKSWNLGIASAIMVALGYPGEIQDNPEGRWMWWFFAMIPFLYVVQQLAVGLSAATDKLATTHGESVASLTGYARWLTIISWLTYPFVYIIKMMGISGVAATAGEQIGYSVADVVAKAVFGVLIWSIASEKSKVEGEAGMLPTGRR